jgi:hypothetical protein
MNQYENYFSIILNTRKLRTKWRGDESTLIDRFDVRSHLDYIAEYKEPSNQEK